MGLGAILRGVRIYKLRVDRRDNVIFALSYRAKLCSPTQPGNTVFKEQASNKQMCIQKILSKDRQKPKFYFLHFLFFCS